MLFGRLLWGQEDQVGEPVQVCQFVEGLENQQHGHEPQKQVNWKEREESEPEADLEDRWGPFLLLALPGNRVARLRWQAWGAQCQPAVKTGSAFHLDALWVGWPFHLLPGHSATHL